MKKIKKLKSNKGESLVESLVAILISALSVTFLATTITTSSRITAQSREKMNEYYSANDVVITQTDGGSSGTVSVMNSDAKIKITSKQTGDSISVHFFTNDILRDVEVTSYKAD